MKYIHQNIVLSNDVKKDFIIFDGKVFHLEYLNPKNPGSKGGNSCVFKLIDKTGQTSDRIIKFSKIPLPLPRNRSNYTKFLRQRFLRFEMEIQALIDANEKEYIVDYFFDGTQMIDGVQFRYYVMEKANGDLTDYILQNQGLDEQERFKFCFLLIQAVQELFSMNLYHRDIKPDNIFLFFDEEDPSIVKWKIGDLGLVGHFDRAINLDNEGEKIGPFGWLSPEAMNKFLTEKSGLGLDCNIDDASDIFQLGKVFWFIYNNNVPIGQLLLSDFKEVSIANESIFEMIKSMLNYSKTNRSNMFQLQNQVNEIMPLVGI